MAGTELRAQAAKDAEIDQLRQELDRSQEQERILQGVLGEREACVTLPEQELEAGGSGSSGAGSDVSK